MRASAEQLDPAGIAEALRQPASGSRNDALCRQQGMEPFVLPRGARDFAKTAAPIESKNPQMTRMEREQLPFGAPEPARRRPRMRVAKHGRSDLGMILPAAFPICDNLRHLRIPSGI